MANPSILAAFERMWQHTIAKIGQKADVDHGHTVIVETNKNLEQRFWRGTQDEYDAIVNKDDSTMYIVTDGEGGGVGSLEDLGVTATAAELNYVEGVTSNIQEQLNSKATTASYKATLPASGWSASAPYTQTVNVAGILETDEPFYDVSMLDSTIDAPTLIEAFGCIGTLASYDGYIVVQCYEEKPTVDIPIKLKVVR